MTGFVAAKVLAGPKSSPLINNMPVTAVIEETNAARTTLVLVDVRVVFEVLGPRLLTESVLGAAFDHSIGISRIPSPSDSHRQTLQQWGKLTAWGSARTKPGPKGWFRLTEDVRNFEWHELLTHAVIGLELGSRRFLGKEGPLACGRTDHRAKQTDHAGSQQDDVRCS